MSDGKTGILARLRGLMSAIRRLAAREGPPSSPGKLGAIEATPSSPYKKRVFRALRRAINSQNFWGSALVARTKREVERVRRITLAEATAAGLLCSVLGAGIAWGTATAAIRENRRDIKHLEVLAAGLVQIKVAQGIAQSERGHISSRLDEVLRRLAHLPEAKAPPPHRKRTLVK